MTVGTALMAIGAVATVVTLLPVFVDLDPLPLPVYLLCFMAPAGLAVLLGALWQRARTRQDRLHRSTTHSP